MQLWKKFLSAFFGVCLTACGASDAGTDLPRLQIVSASLNPRTDGVTLDVALDWHPSTVMLDALDHGIPLALRLRLDAERISVFGWHSTVASRERRLQLRYFPLSRQYALRDLEGEDQRSFSTRAALVAALEALHLALPNWRAESAQRCRLRADFDDDDLPGALRLSAWFDPGWRMPVTELVWPISVAG